MNSSFQHFFFAFENFNFNNVALEMSTFFSSSQRAMIGGTNRRHQDTGGEGGREYLRNCCTKPRSDFLFTKHALFLGLEGPPHFRWDTLLGCPKSPNLSRTSPIACCGLAVVVP